MFVTCKKYLKSKATTCVFMMMINILTKVPHSENDVITEF